DLVGGVYNDDALAELLTQDASHLAALGRLTNAGPAKHQDALSRLHHVTHDVDRSVDSPADAAGEPHDTSAAVADGGDPVERALDPGAIVLSELPYPVGHVVQVSVIYQPVREIEHATRVAGLRLAAEIEDNLQQVLVVRVLFERLPDLG